MVKSNTDTRVDQIDKFHKTKKGRIAFGFAELIIAYLFVSLAINSGSIWQYVLAVIFAAGAFNNLTNAFKKSGRIRTDGKKSAKKR